MSTPQEKYLHEIHQDHNNWIKELEFAKDEIGTFKNRLEEAVSKNTKNEVLSKAEMFQNQFIRHMEVIDHLKHDVHTAEHGIVALAKENNVATDHRKAPVNKSLVDQMESFHTIWKDLKDEFATYLSEVL